MTALHATSAECADAYLRDAGENVTKMVGSTTTADLLAYSTAVQAQALMAIAHRLTDIADRIGPSGQT